MSPLDYTTKSLFFSEDILGIAPTNLYRKSYLGRPMIRSFVFDGNLDKIFYASYKDANSDLRLCIDWMG